MQYPSEYLQWLPSTLVWGFEWGIYSCNVCAYMSVTLRNGNLRYCLGMSIWGHAKNVNLCSRSGIGRHWNVHYARASTEDGVAGGGGQRFLMEEGEDSMAGPSQCMYLAESSAETSAEHSWWLATLMKTKKQKSVHHRSQERKNITKSSKVESAYQSVSTSQVLFFWLPLNQQCKISDNCSTCPTHMHNARRRASYACVFLVTYM